MNLKCALLVPDCHISYHDKKAYKLMLNVAKNIYDGKLFENLTLDEIVILGDYADFYAVNSHGKHPQLMHLLKEEVNSVNFHLDELDSAFPLSKKVFISGNHEARLERFIEQNCPTLFGLTSVQSLFEFHRRTNWTFVEYGPRQLYRVLDSKLYARHEPFSMTSAGASVKKSMINLVFGHTHRIEEATTCDALGTPYMNFSVGWLGDINREKIFDYVKTRPNWELGFGLVFVDPKTKFFYHEKIRILGNYTCVVGGKVFKI